MPKHASKKRRRRRSPSSSDSSGSSAGGERAPPPLRLIQLAALGDRRGARRLLKRRPQLVDATDASGATALHEACRHGHTDVVKQLLKYRANANARDGTGNTPAHVAGQCRNLPLLVMLLQAQRPPDVDLPNALGATVRGLMDALMAPAPPAPAAAPEAAIGPPRPPGSGRGAGAATAAAGGGCGEGSGGGHDDWGERLAEEMSDDEVGGIGYSRYMPRRTPHGGPPGLDAWGDADDEAAWAAAGGGGDDSWAERLWSDMESHRRQVRNQTKAKVYGAARPSVSEAAAARGARAEEARRESERILRQEGARDADWRQAMMQQIRQSAGPPRREAYEAKWAALAALPVSQALHFQDIPWPLPPAAGAGSGEDASAAAPLDAQAFRGVMLQGVEGGPGGVRARLRAEVLRWHPDKFEARWGARLAPGERARVLGRVREVAQMLTQLMSSGGQ